MNLKRITLALFAVTALFCACQEEEDLGTAKIVIDPQTVVLNGPGETSFTVSVTATRDWSVAGIPDWVAVSPAKGTGSREPQTVTVSLNANSEYNRAAELIFSINLMKTRLNIQQPGEKGQLSNGSGTVDDPYTVAGVLEYISTLGASESPAQVYIKGKVSSIKEAYTSNYGNGTFYISDDGTTAADQFYVFRAMYLGNKKFSDKDTQIEVGDDVIVCGKVINYNGNTPETVQNSAYLYSLNGETGGTSGGGGTPEGNGTLDSPYNVAAALDAVKNLTWTDNTTYEKVGPFYVKGIISSIKEAYSTQYGNGTFYIKDEGGSDEFYVFRVLYLGNKKWTASDTQIEVGDEVIIYAELMNYRGNTPETVQNSGYLYSLNGVTGGDTPGPGGDITSTTVADFIAKADGNTYYRLTGSVSNFKTGTNSSGKNWMQFDLTDATGSILVYGFKDGQYDKWANTIKDGGTVVLNGTYQFYDKNQKHEVVNATVESFTEGSGPGPGGDITSTTVADFIAKADGNTYYRLTGSVSNFKTGTNSSGKNWMQFDLTDATGSILVYGFKDGQYDKWAGTIKDNGTVVLNGTYQFYDKNQKHEVVNATVESFTEGSGPGPGGSDNPAGSGTLADPYNPAAAYQIAAALDASTKTEEVYIAGKISSIKYTFSAQYGTATFNISADGTTSGTQLPCYSVYYLENKSWVDGYTQVKVGDSVIIYGKLCNYNGNTPETASKEAYIYSLNGVTEAGEGGGSGGGGGQTTGDFASTVTWTDGSNASYTQDATVNGTSGVKILKLGTSSKYGTSTITLPAPASKLKFYAVSWNNATVADLVFSVGGSKVATVTPKANSGLSGNPTYTITVTDEDYYTVDLGSSVSEVVVETSGGYRAALFGIVTE